MTPKTLRRPRPDPQAQALGVSDELDAPPHLAPATKEWWRRIAKSYDLEPHHLAILTAAGEAWDRLQQARQSIENDGAIYKDRFGQPRKSPAVDIERDSRMAFARLIRELGLDANDPDETRPPRRP
jgi:P27 family predicted phage terminase small subunit